MGGSKPSTAKSTEGPPPVTANGVNLISYLAICAIVNGEPAADLREWVEYHYRMGIGKFYLYDQNGGEVPVAQTLADYIERKIVRAEVDVEVNPQIPVYSRCISQYRAYHKWIGFIDVDEFIVTTGGVTVPSVLQEYEAYEGVLLSLRIYGSSGHIVRPNGGILQNYWTCSNSTHFKPIGNTDFISSDGGYSPYHQNSKGKYSINTDFEKLTADKLSLSQSSLYEVMYLNHYLKSKEDWKHTLKSKNIQSKVFSSLNDFHMANAECKINCTILQMPTTTYAEK